MTTYASPTLGGASASLWRVEMNPHAQGPDHAFVGEVLWTLTAGSATLALDGVTHELAAGDTAVLPADLLRTWTAGPDGFTAMVTTASPGGVWRADDRDTVEVPPWVS
ncbi:cupin domain-containing protein [Gordonia asplenii]|uniref:cupin domain-containing protein n=1 Tax=Gordonia asplenii TaxID=2725283 RepID=UPI001B7D728B|nr:cupin [Gordonia asplenii]